MPKKIVKYLSSLRFTLLLISLLGVMFLLGLWIPQEKIVAPALYAQWKQHSPVMVRGLEALGFTSIYSSPIMLILWVFFFVNLALVMWQRIPLIKKRIALPEGAIGDPATAPGYPFRASYSLPSDMEGTAVVGFLRKRGYVVIGDSSGFCGVKNRLSPLAFGLFHLSFFLILLGGLISVYTRFTGVLELGIGETFQGEVSRYNATPQLPKIGVPPRASFTVLSIVPMISQGTKTGLRVRLVDAKGVEHEADVNRPYKVDSTNFIVDNVGVAPLFVLIDPTGKEIAGAYFKLNVMGGREDAFSIAGFHFRARFYPDYIVKSGEPATQSEQFRNPVFVVSVEQQGKPVTTGTIPIDGSMAFAGYQLALKDLPYWVRFSVFKEHGIVILYAGFAFACLAVVWRFLFYRRELIGAIRGDAEERVLVVAGRSEFYKSLSEDEFTNLFSRLFEKQRRTDS